MSALNWFEPLLGGMIIGVSVSLMLLLNGRVTGISGIINGLFYPPRNENSWRWYFVSGLLAGGWFLQFIKPAAFKAQLSTESWTIIVAGLLVGFGTILGSGCTSGHGICGLSRFSIRSFVATLVFILSGMFSVLLFRKLGVL